MGMKINAHLPIPADLKAEYPLSLKGNQTSFL